MCRSVFYIFIFSTIWFSCSTADRISEHKKLDKIINTDVLVKRVMDSFDKFESQIIYTQINRDKQNKPSFKSYYWNHRPNHYFYPASTVKMPVALLAAEKINRLRKSTSQIHLFSPLKITAARFPQTFVTTDSTSPNGMPSVGHYIKKIFIVSDNDAYNRLYEFIGQQAINQRLQSMGFNVHILHRLDAPEFDTESNKYTNPSELYEEDFNLYSQNEQYNSLDQRIKGLSHLKKGNGYIKKDSLVLEPFDFSAKNFISLQSLHDLIKTIVFPESVPENSRFDIADHDLDYIHIQMSKLPRESKHPIFDSTHADGYCKFLMYGDTKNQMPDHIRIFNKVGWAYGFLTDAAYIVDFKNKVEFMLSATINTNTDGIYNDGKYEYETIGLPYLSKLGKMFYTFELNRKKKITPDLSKFKLNYSE